jgi:hypothetical protein
MQFFDIARFWGVNLSGISLPNEEKVKALVFDTFGTQSDCFMGEEEFDSLDAAKKSFSDDPACNDYLPNGQTSKKVYVVDYTGKVIAEFGAI